MWIHARERPWAGSLSFLIWELLQVVNHLRFWFSLPMRWTWKGLGTKLPLCLCLREDIISHSVGKHQFNWTDKTIIHQDRFPQNLGIKDGLDFPNVCYAISNQLLCSFYYDLQATAGPFLHIWPCLNPLINGCEGFVRFCFLYSPAIYWFSKSNSLSPFIKQQSFVHSKHVPLFSLFTGFYTFLAIFIGILGLLLGIFTQGSTHKDT